MRNIRIPATTKELTTLTENMRLLVEMGKNYDLQNKRNHIKSQFAKNNYPREVENITDDITSSYKFFEDLQSFETPLKFLSKDIHLDTPELMIQFAQLMNLVKTSCDEMQWRLNDIFEDLADCNEQLNDILNEHYNKKIYKGDDPYSIYTYKALAPRLYNKFSKNKEPIAELPKLVACLCGAVTLGVFLWGFFKFPEALFFQIVRAVSYVPLINMSVFIVPGALGGLVGYGLGSIPMLRYKSKDEDLRNRINSTIAKEQKKRIAEYIAERNRYWQEQNMQPEYHDTHLILEKGGDIDDALDAISESAHALAKKFLPFLPEEIASDNDVLNQLLSYVQDGRVKDLPEALDLYVEEQEDRARRAEIIQSLKNIAKTMEETAAMSAELAERARTRQEEERRAQKSSAGRPYKLETWGGHLHIVDRNGNDITRVEEVVDGHCWGADGKRYDIK